MSTAQNFLNSAVVLSLLAPGTAIITTKNPMWRVALVVLPALMALNMKKQITLIDAPAFSVPIVGLTLAAIVYLYIDKKTAESVKTGEKKRTLVFFGVMAFLFVLLSVSMAGFLGQPYTSSFSTQPSF